MKAMKLGLLALTVLPTIALANSRVGLEDLKVEQEEVLSERVDLTANLDKTGNYPQTILDGNYPNTVLNGNYPDTLLNANYPNSVMSGNYPDTYISGGVVTNGLENVEEMGALPSPRE